MSSIKVKIDNKEIKLPVIVGTEDEHGIDITKLRKETGFITLDPGYANTGACISNITFIDPVGYISMLSLLKNCEMIITDSGGLQKESYFAKKKCLTVREQTEWVELINNGSNILCKPEDLKDSYYKILNEEVDFSNIFFGDGNASNFITKSIEKFF